MLRYGWCGYSDRFLKAWVDAVVLGGVTFECCENSDDVWGPFAHRGLKLGVELPPRPSHDSGSISGTNAFESVFDGQIGALIQAL